MILISGPTINSTALEIVSLANFKASVGINATGEDTRIQRLLDEIHFDVYSYTGRVIKYSATPWVVVLRPNTQDKLWLPQYPIVAMTSVQQGHISSNALAFTANVTIGTDEYYPNKAAGYLALVSGGWWSGVQTRVEWTAGFSALPMDLDGAIMEWAAVKYDRLLTKRMDVAAESRERLSRVYREYEIPARAREILDRYRRLENTVGL